MTRPGTALRALARRACSASTIERLIDPMIADLQCEHADALRQGRRWRSRWIRTAGYIAFWKVVAMQTGWSFRRTIGEWAAADNQALGRTCMFSLASVAALVVFQDLPGLLRLWPRLQAGETVPFVASLAALAIPAAITFGLPIGILCGLRGRLVTAHTRRAVLAISVGGAIVQSMAVALIAPAGSHAPLLVVGGQAMVRVTFAQTSQLRIAGAAMSLVFCLLALGAASITGGATRSIAIGLTAPVVTLLYGVLFISRGFGASLPPAVLAWTPVFVFGAVAIAMLSRVSPATRDGAP